MPQLDQYPKLETLSSGNVPQGEKAKHPKGMWSASGPAASMSSMEHSALITGPGPGGSNAGGPQSRGGKDQAELGRSAGQCEIPPGEKGTPFLISQGPPAVMIHQVGVPTKALKRDPSLWQGVFPLGQFYLGKPLQGAFDGTWHPLHAPQAPDQAVPWDDGAPHSAETGGFRGEAPALFNTATPKSVSDEKHRNTQEFWNRQLALKYETAGKTSKAERIRACKTKFRAVMHVCGHEDPHVVTNQCGVMGCSLCQGDVARELSFKVRDMVKAVKKHRYRKGYKLLHVVLTSRTGKNAGQEMTPDVIDGNFKALWEGWSGLWNKHLKSLSPDMGAIVKGEVGSGGMCHLEVLVWGLGWLDQTWLHRRWEELTGWKSVKVNLAYKRKKGKWWRDGATKSESGAIVEATKYVCKPICSSEDLELVAAVGLALHAKRNFRTYGVFYGKKLKAILEPTKSPCPKCGELEWLMGPWCCDVELAKDEALEKLESFLSRGPPGDCGGHGMLAS